MHPKSTSYGEKICAIIGFIEDMRSRSGLMPHPQQVGKDPKPRPTVVQVFIPPKRARLSNTCLWIWTWDMAGVWDPEKGSVAILRVWGEKKAEGEKEREACRWLELENGVQAGKGHGAYQVIACFAFECSHGVLHVIIIIFIIFFTYFSCWIASLTKDIELFGSNGALMIPWRAFIGPLQESNGVWVKAVVNGAWCSCVTTCPRPFIFEIENVRLRIKMRHVDASSSGHQMVQHHLLGPMPAVSTSFPM